VLNKKHDNVYEVSGAYTITDTDNYEKLLVTTGASDRTIDLPTAADNKYRIITIMKVDSGAGKMTVDGEAGENLHAMGQDQNTIDFEKENSGITVISNGTDWDVIATFGCELWDIDGTIEAVYTKFFSGTLDNDSLTTVAHGISDYDKIVHGWATPFNNSANRYYLVEVQYDAAAANQFVTYYDSSNVVFTVVGANYQGRNYRASLKYYI
jgi:hypothetical protein